jgi:Undecaprenyl-phosphate galactose phosphotransferase WbaP
MFGRCSWWGYPVIVFGSSLGAAQTLNELRRHPETGLRPIAVLTETGDEDEIEGVEVIGTHSQGPVYALNLGVHRAVIAMPDAHSSELSRLVEHSARLFTHVYVLTRLAGLSSLGVEIRDVGNMLALEFQRSLLVPSHQAVKRVIDILASFALLLLLAPAMAVIALLIRREAKAPIFYAQNRLGRDGRTFRMWKFRSMLPDSAALLEELLRNDPAARAEWEANHKLRNDPRITSLGSILRKTSLDELPQLWNVLKGDMSLVGPRPIVNDEIVKYGEGYDFYKRVVPGLTGLWQVSGRSETTYDERVGLDIYYVRNWSPWLDVYLLARTVTVVLTGKGSY